MGRQRCCRAEAEEPTVHTNAFGENPGSEKKKKDRVLHRRAKRGSRRNGLRSRSACSVLVCVGYGGRGSGGRVSCRSGCTGRKRRRPPESRFERIARVCVRVRARGRRALIGLRPMRHAGGGGKASGRPRRIAGTGIRPAASSSSSLSPSTLCSRVLRSDLRCVQVEAAAVGWGGCASLTSSSP